MRGALRVKEGVLGTGKGEERLLQLEAMGKKGARVGPAAEFNVGAERGVRGSPLALS